MTPTHFSLRGDQYKFTTYYGLYDTDELFDIQADPMEQNNLIHDPEFAGIHMEMQTPLYEMMDDLGGMDIPMNATRGKRRVERLRPKGGVDAADFPDAFLVDDSHALARNAKPDKTLLRLNPEPMLVKIG